MVFTGTRSRLPLFGNLREKHSRSHSETRAHVVQSIIVGLRPFRHLPTWARYLIASSLVVLLTLIRYQIGGTYLYPFLLYLPIIIFVSLVFDRGSGLFATFTSAIFALYFLIPPHWSLTVESERHALGLGAFLLTGLATALTLEALRETVDALADSYNKLKESQTKYKAILDTAIEAIIIIDEKGIMQSFNPAAERIFGYKTEEVLGRNVKMLMPPEEAHVHDAYIERYLKTGEAKVIGIGRDVEGLTKDGRSIPLGLSITEWRDATGKRFFTGIMRDISEQKIWERQLRKTQDELQKTNQHLEELVEEKTHEVMAAESKLFHAQKLEAIGQAIGIIAHDFKNILNPIGGTVKLLRGKFTHENADVAHLFSVLEKAQQDGKTLINDIMLFSRKTETKPLPTDLNALITENKSLIRESISDDVVLSLELEGELPPTCIDRDLFKRAILNIAINASDAMPRGGLLSIRTSTVEIGNDGSGPGAEKSWQPGEYILVSIEDTGLGMTEEVKNKIFEPFFTTKPLGQGTGLGMAMVADFMRQSKGYIDIKSTPGEGTTIKLYHPVC